MSKENSQLVTTFDEIISNNTTPFTLKRINAFHIDITDNYYNVGSLRIMKSNLKIVFCQKNAEIFKIHNAFGILKSVIENQVFPFEEMRFQHNGNIYITSKEIFLEFGIEQKFIFGIKLFLPLNKFLIENLNEPTFGF